MSPKTRVAIAGASGVTGSSIVNALLATPGQFEVTALARPSSVQKKEYVEFAKRGVIVKPAELDGPLDAVIELLTGVDVVISCMTLIQLKEELALVTAAKGAGVGRYVPSFFAPCSPPRGVMLARGIKEDILDHIKRLYLPYTAVDVGWWYQLSLPPSPSGKYGIKAEYSTTEIVGEGNNPWALTDNRDIGRYVAKIIVDPRTLNKSVFAYGEIWTQNEVYDLVEKIAGESIQRKHVTEQDLTRIISESQETTAKNSLDPVAMLNLGMAQYKFLLGIRGDNTPEHAKYLGYLSVKELYPDVVATPLEDYIRGLVEGTIKTVYS